MEVAAAAPAHGERSAARIVIVRDKARLTSRAEWEPVRGGADSLPGGDLAAEGAQDGVQDAGDESEERRVREGTEDRQKDVTKKTHDFSVPAGEPPKTLGHDIPSPGAMRTSRSSFSRFSSRSPDREHVLSIGLPRRRRLAIAVVAGAALAAVAIFVSLQVLGAARAGNRGRAALTRAEADLSARRLDESRTNLDAAHAAFTRTQEKLEALGPLASVARRTPLIGRQVRAVDAFAAAGLSLSRAGLDLVQVAGSLIDPSDERLPISEALDALRSTHASLAPAVAAIEAAAQRVADVEGSFLLPPLSRARDDLEARLPRIRARAASAEQGMAALIAFAGGSGPKRYLFLSQNPDEVRPTGGFIGTYGVLTAEAGQIRLERYDGIETWTGSRPEARVPVDEVGSPFRFRNPPVPRTLGNVNSGPDWPESARLAAELWERGGEEPVDGVISFTPGFLGRILAVTGPVTIDAYGETVTAANLNERLDFQTHQAPPAPGTDRKDFVAAVAETVMQRLLEAPSSKWEPLGRAMSEAFDAREAVAWSTDEQVATALADREWDGAFPSFTGDFFFNSEFAYASKNGRGIRRAYDHHVELRPDGSARITTTVTITNTEPAEEALNESTLAYHTIYGPEGARLDEEASDPFGFPEPAVAGHPATGWFRAAKPDGGQQTLTVVWEAPGIARWVEDGTLRYALRWRNLPDHTGDTVKLTVDLPEGWRWKDEPPPNDFSLDRPILGAWDLATG